MLEPINKAAELIKSYTELGVDYNTARYCAKLLVVEVINSQPSEPYYGGWYELDSDRIEACIEYWNDVLLCIGSEEIDDLMKQIKELN